MTTDSDKRCAHRCFVPSTTFIGCTGTGAGFRQESEIRGPARLDTLAVVPVLYRVVAGLGSERHSLKFNEVVRALPWCLAVSASRRNTVNPLLPLSRPRLMPRLQD